MASYFPHAGPIEERIPGAPMHCRTVLPNHECRQLRAGCLGCTLNWHQEIPPSPWAASALGLAITVQADAASLRAALLSVTRAAAIVRQTEGIDGR